MAAKKQEAILEKPRTPCAADPTCRYTGMLWMRTLQHDQRVCVDHYCIAISRDRSLADDGTVPPRKKMFGIPAKQVAGE